MRKLALLVIDVQNALVEAKPYNCNQTIDNIKRLIDECRENEIEVIYIQHCGKDGGQLEKGSWGWQIIDVIRPETTEKIIEKHYNSAFKETELKSYLDKKGIADLIVTGMQTEYCIDTSIKVAFEYGYNLLIPQATNTTYDNEMFSGAQIYSHYNELIFKDRFGKTVPVDEVIRTFIQEK